MNAKQTRISAALRNVISTQAANVANVVSEISTAARGEALHYALALDAISVLWTECKGHVGLYTEAISELASDVHETCEAEGIKIGRRAKEDDGEADDDADKRERGRVNTFMSQFRVIARKVGETNGAFDLDRMWWKCYESAKAAGTGSNRSKKKAATTPSALAAHPAKELADALIEQAKKDDKALIEAFRTVTTCLQARGATLDLTAVTTISKRYAA